MGSVHTALQQHPHRIPVNSFNLNPFAPSPDVHGGGGNGVSFETFILTLSSFFFFCTITLSCHNVENCLEETLPNLSFSWTLVSIGGSFDAAPYFLFQLCRSARKDFGLFGAKGELSCPFKMTLDHSTWNGWFSSAFVFLVNISRSC